MGFTVFNFGGFDPSQFKGAFHGAQQDAQQGGTYTPPPQRERKPRKPIGTPATRTLINLGVTLLFALTYPLAPSQLTLVNMTTIGIPSFILAMEFNKELVRGKFLRSVLSRAMPAGVTDFIVILAAVLICTKVGIAEAELSTMSMFIMGFVGFMTVFQTCRPFNLIRRIMIIALAVIFVLGSLILPGLFSIVPLTGKAWLITAALMAASVPVMILLTQLSYLIGVKRPPSLFRRAKKETHS